MAFNHIIAPISVEEFFKRYYEQEILYVSRDGKEDYFDHILSISDINQFLRRDDFGNKPIKIIKDGKPKFYPKRGKVNSSLPEILDDLSNNGFTLVLDKLKHYVNKLSNFIIELHQEYPIRFGTNIYITPANSQGFNIHYDHHDVLILQLFGNKKWDLYDTPVQLPDRTMMPLEHLDYSTTEPEKQITINAGDTLYIPRGKVHRASTTNMPSIHVTLGINQPQRGIDLVREWQKSILTDVFFRKSIFHLSQDAVEDYEKAFKQKLHAQIDSINIVELSRNLNKKNQDELLSHVEGVSLMDYLSSYKKFDNTVLFEKKSKQPIEFYEKSPFLIIKVNKIEHSFPLFLRPIFLKLNKGDTISINNIQTLLNTNFNSASQLVRKMIRQGIVSPSKQVIE